MTYGDLLVAAIILFLVGTALWVLWHDHKTGKRSCGGCSGCCNCHEEAPALVQIQDEDGKPPAL